MSTHRLFQKGGTATAEPPATARDAVLEFLNGVPRPVSAICAATGLPQPSVETALVGLRVEGLAEPVGEQWIRLQAAQPAPPDAAPTDNSELAQIRAMMEQLMAQNAEKDRQIAALQAGQAAPPEPAPPAEVPTFGKHVVNVTDNGNVYTLERELSRFEHDGMIYVVGLESLSRPPKTTRAGKTSKSKPSLGVGVRHVYWHDKDGRYALDARGIQWVTVAKLQNVAWQKATQAAWEAVVDVIES